ncbi:MAG: hypothetical protein QCH35_07720 [Methanomicrobiaceae archaeon]|nr:hypothetical protein [Methanomicrobiaceae archaeon]
MSVEVETFMMVVSIARMNMGREKAGGTIHFALRNASSHARQCYGACSPRKQPSLPAYRMRAREAPRHRAASQRGEAPLSSRYKKDNRLKVLR